MFSFNASKTAESTQQGKRTKPTCPLSMHVTVVVLVAVPTAHTRVVDAHVDVSGHLVTVGGEGLLELLQRDDGEEADDENQASEQQEPAACVHSHVQSEV